MNTFLLLIWSALTAESAIHSVRSWSWEPFRLADRWPSISAHFDVSPSCHRHLDIFFTALLDNQLWATSVVDSSGRRSAGLLWGNSYWLGFHGQCQYLNDQYHHFNDSSYSIGGQKVEMETTSTRETVLENSQRLDQTAPFRLSPPYRLTFAVATLQIDAPHSGPAITLGVCVPEVCSSDDIHNLLQLSLSLEGDIHKRTDAHPEKVLTLRMLDGAYNFMRDKKFIILASITSVMALLTMLATIFDYLNDSGLEMKDKLQPNLEIIQAKTGSERKKMSVDLLQAFSLRLNVRKIFEWKSGEDTLRPIHGIKCITLVWVILAHVCLSMHQLSDNKTFRAQSEKQFLFQTLSNGTYSVDTFFFLSGSLVSFLYFRSNWRYSRQLQRFRGFIGCFTQYTLMIIHRVIRLSPPYLAVLLMVEVSMKYHNSNHALDLPSKDYVNCDKFWWRNMLYINTWYPVKDSCMVWSWYLGDDTQFYALACFTLIIATRHLRLAFGILVAVMASAWTTTAIMAYKTNFVISVSDPLAHYDDLYSRQWTRIGPYIVGLTTGWFLFRINCKLSMPMWSRGMLWCASISTMLMIMYGSSVVREPSVYMSALAAALSHTAWSAALAWTLIWTVTQKKSAVSRLLSHSLFFPFSRLTYCAYLIHPAIIKSALFINGAPTHLSIPNIAIMFLGFTVLSFWGALLVSLLFEAPFVSMLTVIKYHYSTS